MRSTLSMDSLPTSLCNTSFKRFPSSLQSSSKLWNDISSAMSSVVSVIVPKTTPPPSVRDYEDQNTKNEREKMCFMISDLRIRIDSGVYCVVLYRDVVVVVAEKEGDSLLSLCSYDCEIVFLLIMRGPTTYFNNFLNFV